MKTTLSILLSVLLLSLCNTQNVQAQSTPNGDFESWVSGTYETPQNYNYSSNPSTFFRCNGPFNCVKVADPYHGSFAIKLTTELGGTDTCFGYFLNANANGAPSTWTGGIPYTQKATGIRGYYKSAIPTNDSGTIATVFKFGGLVIGADVFKFYGTHSTYTPFSFTFSSPLLVNPDTVIFAAASSDVFNNFAISGSMLQLDSVSFTGVASQPALFNGDFETWQNHTLRRPTSWYYNGDDQGSGLFQTADAYAGNFALELKTYIGDNNGVAQAQPAITSTGYYNCPGGVCNQYGGYPFTNKKDTLAFYYKYAPTISTDSGQVSIAFKKNKVFFSYVGSMLKAAATYQYVEIPFDLPQIPDSVTVQFNSGLFNNTALTYVGADLKVDDVHFKSQSITTGIFDVANGAKINIYPNPGHGLFNIQSDTKISSVEIVNLQGQTVYSAQMDSYKPTVDLSKQPKGSYFYTLRSKNKIISWGKLLVQ